MYEVTIMSNFNFLLSEPVFQSFADVAIAAEKILDIDPAAIFADGHQIDILVNY